MKRWMLSLALLISASTHHSNAQNMLEHRPAQAPQKFVEGDQKFFPTYTVNPGHLAVRAMEIKGFDEEGKDKLERAFALMEEVVNSEEFKDRVINFKNSKGERAFASNKGKSNEEIYQQFIEGREILQPNTPGEMNFYLRLYYKRWSRVVGYTDPKTNVISINWKFFQNYFPHQVAGNLAHEWTHKIGFDHRSAAEHDSAPYAIGQIVEELAGRYQQGVELH
jgi:hypothetical protein